METSRSTFISERDTLNSKKKRIAVIVTNEAFIPRKSSSSPSSFESFRRERTEKLERPETVADDQIWRELTTANNARNPRLTGVDLLEVGYFWMILSRQLKHDIDFISPRGGAVAVDPISLEMVHKDEKLRNHLKEDKEFYEKLSHTFPIEWVKPESYEMVLLPGKHGVMFDLPESDEVSRFIVKIHDKGCLVGAIGHGCAGLLNAKTSKGDYLLKNRRIACSSNKEEREKHYDELLPYLLEDSLRERGAKIENKESSQPNVVVDERLITGQNALSIKDFVRKIAEHLGHREMQFN